MYRNIAQKIYAGQWTEKIGKDLKVLIFDQGHT